ncbi:MAG: histidinol-phosphatase [Subdoligranulum sp.]|nr:histidinol-phosphatase [Subdoligranulum sp.]
MILTSSTHNHCTLCDGKNTPAEMAEAALAAGFTDLGFSSHSRTPFDPSYSIRDEAEYVRVMRALQKEYAGRLRISVGLEQDFYAPVQNRAALDYIIGSVHYLRGAAGKYYAMDGPAEMVDECARQEFGGDTLAMVRAYYALVAENARRYRPEVIGHFDLVKKNNGQNRLFCEDDPAYRAAALEALKVCADTGAVFELNTGGIFRRICEEPYPARFLLEALCARGARVTVNGDAHCTGALTFWFDEALALLRDVGFGSVAVWENGAFVDRPL